MFKGDLFNSDHAHKASHKISRYAAVGTSKAKRINQPRPVSASVPVQVLVLLYPADLSSLPCSFHERFVSWLTHRVSKRGLPTQPTEDPKDTCRSPSGGLLEHPVIRSQLALRHGTVPLVLLERPTAGGPTCRHSASVDRDQTRSTQVCNNEFKHELCEGLLRWTNGHPNGRAHQQIHGGTHPSDIPE